MTEKRLRRFFLTIVLTIVAVSAAISLSLQSRAQVPAGTTLDAAAGSSGNNYDKAEFKLWYPTDAGAFRAVIVLVPGSNGDGRPMVEEPAWQAFAIRHKLALVGCRFTDKPHEQNFIEQYVDASHGSGQALLDALVAFSGRSKHPELAAAPLLLWGMSAGGEFNYEFVAWKPERVIAFVVNKGGIYYTALTSQAARNVPGILFVGGKDLEFRTNTIVGLFAVNRRSGALWALAEEPGAAHIVGRSRDMAAIFFEDMLGLRLGEPSSGSTGGSALRPLAEKAGFIGDLKAKTFQAMGEAGAPNYPTAWLPTLRVARAWQALVSEKPFEP
jgi:poly(3-hydroxybutyrate) depolymerase